MGNPFADLYPQGGTAQDTQEAPVPVTSYSLPAVTTGGAGDKMYDPDTARGVGIGETELTPGVVAVNPKVYPHGTIFKDPNTNQVFIAADTHGNKNPNVIDIYTPPSQYTGESALRNLVPIGRIPKNAIPKNATALRQLLSQFGNVPEGESASESLSGVNQSEPQQPAPQATNPFADLYPQEKQATPAPTPVSADNPFADLYSKEGKPLAEAKSEIPWYKNLGGSLTAQTAAQSIRAAEGFERAGAAPVTDISGVNAPFQRGAKKEEATAAFDKAIADRKAALESIQSIVNKQGFTAPEYSGQINDLQREIGDLQAQKEQTLALPQYSPEAQQALALQRQELGKTAAGLKSTAKSMYPYFGVNEQDKAASAQIGRGIGNILSMAPAMLAGPAALPLMTIQAASTAYGEGYNAKAEELKQQGVTDQSEIDNQAHEAGSSAAVKTVPQLAIYIIGGKLTSEATGVLLKGASPLVKGLVGGGAASAGNVVVSAGLRAMEGQPLAPTIEGTVQDLLFGAFPGLGTGLEARAEARRAREATGQPAPEVAPSANPIVNEKEAQIIAGANDQFVPAPEIKINVEKPPLTPAFEGAAPVESLEDLYFQQAEHDEGTPDYIKYQEKIDALKKGETPPKQEPSVAEQAPQAVSAAGETPAVEPTAEKAQPKKPNAIQITSPEETLLRTQGERPSTGVELPGVGEEVPKEAPPQGEAPKEEVTVPNTLGDAKTPEEVDSFVKAERQRLSQMFPTNTSNESVNIRNKVDLGKRSKALGMEAAAIKRRITGNLTAKEKAAKAKREESNYVGKPVSVDGKNGTVIGNPFGRVKIRFEDGTESTHLPEKIETPVEVKPTTPTIETTGEGMLFGNDKLPFNLAGEVMAPEPEKPPVRTAEDQELPMGEAPAPAPEAPPEPPKKSAPIRDILRRFQNGDEDGISTLQDLQKAIRDAARVLRNKNLRERSAEIQEAIDVGVNTEDAESLVSSTLALLEREANYLDNPPKLEDQFTYKSKGGRKKYFGFEGDEVMQFVLDSKILDPAEWERRHKSGQYAGTKGGEYDAYLRGNVDIPKYYYDKIFSKKGKTRGIEEVATDLNMTPDQLWTYIDEAIKKAKSTRLEEEARNKSLKAHLDEINRLDKLKKDNPEAYAAAVEDDVKAYIATRMGREGGYFELPQIIYDAAVSIGNSIRETGKNFADWSKEMALRLGDGIKNHLRQIWDAYKKSRFASESGAVDIGGGRPERFSPEEARRRATVKRLFDIVSKNEGKPGFEKFSDLLARKYPDLKNDPSALRELYSMASGERKGFAMPSKEAPPAAAAMAQGETTGLQRAVRKQEAELAGRLFPEKGAAQKWQDNLDKAKVRIDADQLSGARLVDKIIEGGQKGGSTEDAFTLLADRIRLSNLRDIELETLANPSISDPEKVSAQKRLDGINEQIERADMAVDTFGSSAGRTLNAYKIIAARDYSVEGLKRKERTSTGKPLSEQQIKRIEKEAESIEQSRKNLEELTEKDRQAQERYDLQNAYAKTIEELKAELAARPKVEPQIQRIIDLVSSSIKEKANNARERVRQRQKEGRFMTGLNPEDIIDHAIIGADYILEGATDITKFTARMVKELGEYVRPYIKDIFAASKKEYDATVIANAKAKYNEVKKVVSQKPKQESIPVIKAKAKAEAFLPGFDTLDSELTHKVVYDLARQHILEGIKGEDNVMRAVHNDIKDIFPDATERDVRRAFSEYGKAKFPSKEADRVALAELRTLTRLQESIDRLTEGLPALRTGLQRNKATQAIREKQKQVNELLKNVKLPPTAEELVSRDAAKQTALRNRIADLDKQLRTGEKIKRTPTEPDSQATEDLRLEKNALEQLLKEVEGEASPKKSPEEQYNERRQKFIKKRVAELQDKINKNQYERAKKKEAPVQSQETKQAELEYKKKKNEFDRKQLRYEELNKPKWQQRLRTSADVAKEATISGINVIGKLATYGGQRLVMTPVEEIQGKAWESLIRKLPGFEHSSGKFESGGDLLKAIGEYYKNVASGVKEAYKSYVSGEPTPSETLYGKIYQRPKWYAALGTRLHGPFKHPFFSGREGMYIYRGLANAEKLSPGSSKDPLTRAYVAMEASKAAMHEKLMEDNKLSNVIQLLHTWAEAPDPKTGKPSISKNTISTLLKVLLFKDIYKVPLNWTARVIKEPWGIPIGLGRILKAYAHGIDNLKPEEFDAISRAFKVGGAAGAVSVFGFLDAFKDDKDKVFGGYYTAGQKRSPNEPKFGTVRIMGHDHHVLAHIPLLAQANIGNTMGRIVKSQMKKGSASLPEAMLNGFASSLFGVLSTAPIASQFSRFNRPNPDYAGQLLSSPFRIAFLSDIAGYMDSETKRKPVGVIQNIEMGLPGFRQNVPLAKPKGSGGNVMPALPNMPSM